MLSAIAVTQRTMKIAKRLEPVVRDGNLAGRIIQRRKTTIQNRLTDVIDATRSALAMLKAATTTNRKPADIRSKWLDRHRACANW
jgi:hypothetical protein